MGGVHEAPTLYREKAYCGLTEQVCMARTAPRRRENSLERWQGSQGTISESRKEGMLAHAVQQ